MSDTPNERQLSTREVAAVLERLITDGRGFTDADAMFGLEWTGLRGGPFGNPSRQRDKETVTRMMAEMVAPEMRYESVLESMDRRVLLDEVARTTDDEELAQIATQWSSTLDETIPVEQEADQALAAAGLAEAPPPLITDESPDAMLQAFNEAVSQFGSPQGAVPFITDADITHIFRTSSSDAAAFADYERRLGAHIAVNDPNFADPFRVHPTDIDAYRAGNINNVSSEARKEGYTGTSYTLSEARDLLYGMTSAEIRELQMKLADAGYFQTDDASGDEPLLWGDSTDARTQSAWRNLIGDAVRTRQPLYTVLDARILSARKSGLADDEADGAADEQARPDVVLTDQARIRLNADDMARQTLGRKFTADEHEALIEFIHGLERGSQNARYDDPADRAAVTTGADAAERRAEAGIEPVSTAGDVAGAPGGPSREFEAVDVNAQIEEYIRRENPVEAEGRDAALTYNDFTALLAGPGRGGSF